MDTWTVLVGFILIRWMKLSGLIKNPRSLCAQFSLGHIVFIPSFFTLSLFSWRSVFGIK